MTNQSVGGSTALLAFRLTVMGRKGGWLNGGRSSVLGMRVKGALSWVGMCVGAIHGRGQGGRSSVMGGFVPLVGCAKSTA